MSEKWKKVEICCPNCHVFIAVHEDDKSVRMYVNGELIEQKDKVKSFEVDLKYINDSIGDGLFGTEHFDILGNFIDEGVD